VVVIIPFTRVALVTVHAATCSHHVQLLRM